MEEVITLGILAATANWSFSGNSLFVANLLFSFGFVTCAGAAGVICAFVIRQMSDDRDAADWTDHLRKENEILEWLNATRDANSEAP
ncbi:hypothetical protein [Mycobacteroides abscessus]|uniref:hypothetical protein n=1 Tax=Mycobacteroides abscessus TaxID=36809 RepID=UPI000C25F839|nr:hypothetical protein [Mycobacteroides abscessus]